MAGPEVVEATTFGVIITKRDVKTFIHIVIQFEQKKKKRKKT